MELYLIEVRDTEDKFRTIRRGVRASLETAKSLVSELLQEYLRKGYQSSAITNKRYEDGSFFMYWFFVDK